MTREDIEEIFRIIKFGNAEDFLKYVKDEKLKQKILSDDSIEIGLENNFEEIFKNLLSSAGDLTELFEDKLLELGLEYVIFDEEKIEKAKKRYQEHIDKIMTSNDEEKLKALDTILDTAIGTNEAIEIAKSIEDDTIKEQAMMKIPRYGRIDVIT